MSEIEVAPCLLLVELDAEVPEWVGSARISCLDQQANELHRVFVERSASWIVEHPDINTVVVALSAAGPQSLDEHVQTHGERIVSALDGRSNARLLFGAPASISEPLRRRLLGLIATLAQNEKGQRACIVGAHFSASPPSSSKIPVVQG